MELAVGLLGSNVFGVQLGDVRASQRNGWVNCSRGIRCFSESINHVSDLGVNGPRSLTTGHKSTCPIPWRQKVGCGTRGLVLNLALLPANYMALEQSHSTSLSLLCHYLHLLCGECTKAGFGGAILCGQTSKAPEDVSAPVCVPETHAKEAACLLHQPHGWPKQAKKRFIL